MKNILVIEDEKNIREDLMWLLKSSGYTCDSVDEFSSSFIMNKLDESMFDLILLDINLDDENGLVICKEIRKKYNIPIIFLTANDSVSVELEALTLGGDDYIKKPYHPAILLTRITNALKHAIEIETLEYKGVKFNPESYTVTYNNSQIELSKSECRLLGYLFEHKGSVVSRVDLISHLWDNDVFIDDNALSVNMTRLRSRLEDIGVIDFIKTKRGVGYQI